MIMGWIKIGIDETCHVAYRVFNRAHDAALHGIGDGAEGNKVTDNLAAMRFNQSRCVSPWLPVIFASRAALHGQRSFNCVTAALGAVRRGWLYF
jgi:hypothetical protein